MRTLPLELALLLVLAGCDTSLSPLDETSNDDESGHGGSVLDLVEDLPGEDVVVTLRAGELAYLDLDGGNSGDAGAGDTQWDLAFRDWDVFTNSGPSGSGEGAGFGPNEEEAFLSERIPEVPFLRADVTGGAFLDWYAYDGSDHKLYSRYHVYGVRDADELWKVQILGYYGQELGAPKSALYRVRYARVTESGSDATRELTDVDGSAGYPDVSDEAPSGCLDLRSGEVELLRPDAARASESWQLCFRRDVISVNGGKGGPGAASSVDLDADAARDEQLSELQAKTAEDEAARFDAVSFSDLSREELAYRGDRVISIFTDAWYEGRTGSRKPRLASWLLRSGDGERYFSVVFRELSTEDGVPTRIRLRVREQTAP